MAETEEKLAQMKIYTKEIISKHTDAGPESALICTVSDGQVRANVTHFLSTGDLLFAQKILNRFIDESIEFSLAAQKGAKAEHTPAPPDSL